jgi:hypothetical protein
LSASTSTEDDRIFITKEVDLQARWAFQNFPQKHISTSAWTLSATTSTESGNIFITKEADLQALWAFQKNQKKLSLLHFSLGI